MALIRPRSARRLRRTDSPPRSRHRPPGLAPARGRYRQHRSRPPAERHPRSAARPATHALLHQEQPVDLCIVHKLDRLALNRADDVAIHLALRQAGVTLVEVRTVTVDPERAPLVAWAFKADAAGNPSRPDLADDLAVRGLYRGFGKRTTINHPQPARRDLPLLHLPRPAHGHRRPRTTGRARLHRRAPGRRALPHHRALTRSRRRLCDQAFFAKATLEENLRVTSESTGISETILDSANRLHAQFWQRTGQLHPDIDPEHNKETLPHDQRGRAGTSTTWWSYGDSNPGPSHCERDALPTAP